MDMYLFRRPTKDMTYNRPSVNAFFLRCGMSGTSVLRYFDARTKRPDISESDYESRAQCGIWTVNDWAQLQQDKAQLRLSNGFIVRSMRPVTPSPMVQLVAAASEKLRGSLARVWGLTSVQKRLAGLHPVHTSRAALCDPWPDVNEMRALPPRALMLPYLLQQPPCHPSLPNALLSKP